METACYRTRREKVWKRIFWGTDFRSYRRVRNARRKKRRRTKMATEETPEFFLTWIYQMCCYGQNNFL